MYLTSLGLNTKHPRIQNIPVYKTSPHLKRLRTQIVHKYVTYSTYRLSAYKIFTHTIVSAYKISALCR